MKCFWDGVYREQECWAETASRLIALAELQAGASVLDVGTGYGGTLFRALEHVGPAGRILSIDTERKCVEWTQREIARRGIPNAEVLEMDAHSMSFADAGFDAAIVGLVGLDDDYDFDAGTPIGGASIVGEIFRVLIPGGHVCISGWLRQDDSEWMGRLIRRQLPGCTKRGYAPGTEVGYVDILTRAGFEGIRVEATEGCYAFESPAEWLATLKPVWKSELEQICALPGGEEALEREALELLAEHTDAQGRVAYTRPAIFLTARKPATGS